jgi:S-adenosylmethionine decarboxylase
MQHLVVDGFVDEASRISELDSIFDLLQRLPGVIGMTMITQPYVFRYHGVVPEDWGITGVVIIAESHISIHTFPARRRFHLDVFSCKPFDAVQAVGLIEARLGVTRRAADVIRRPVLGHEVEAAAEPHWRLHRLPAPPPGAPGPPVTFAGLDGPAGVPATLGSDVPAGESERDLVGAG